jgi:hypothetical protein
MRPHRWGPLLSLVRQGIALEVGYGGRSLEALLWVAETVEEAVYAPGSLALRKGTLTFGLLNPPLRVGAFHRVRLAVEGRPVAPDQLRFRTGEGQPWRSAAEVSAEAPLRLAPGRPVAFAATGVGPLSVDRPTVRLELESVAIPPLVWLEFADAVRREDGT